jgi:hypothetical protein
MARREDTSRLVPAGRSGRAALTAALWLFVAAIALWNLPAGLLRAQARPVLRPVMLRLGLHQDWGLFSPNPARRSQALEARVQLADGSLENVTLPLGDPLLGALRGYRWRKWQGRVLDPDQPELSSGFARWVARDFTQDPRGLRHVALVRRRAATPPPGSQAPLVWEEFEIYRLTPLFLPAPRQ